MLSEEGADAYASAPEFLELSRSSNATESHSDPESMTSSRGGELHVDSKGKSNKPSLGRRWRLKFEPRDWHRDIPCADVAHVAAALSATDSKVMCLLIFSMCFKRASSICSIGAGGAACSLLCRTFHRRPRMLHAAAFSNILFLTLILCVRPW